MRLRLVGPLLLCLALASPAALAYHLEGGRWPDSQIPITWYLDADGTAALGPNTTTASVKAAAVAGFNAWHSVSGVKIAFNAPIDLAAGSRNAQNDGKNKIYWVEKNEGWQYDSATLGVTTPLWYQGSGEIVDADIEFNARDYRWQTGPNSYTTCAPSSTYPGGCADTLSIAVHEEGHFIGIAHSCEINQIEAGTCGQAATDAVMLAAYPGYPKQVLQSDDIAAVRALYPAPNPGSGLQGYACTQDVDCASPLKCRNAKGGGNKICTQTCASAGAAGCPSGLACLEANTGFACLPPTDAVGDLCHSCASGSGCSSGQCMQTQEFAYCSRACSSTTACPGSGYVCVGVQNGQGVQCQAGMSNCFCFPTSGACANNCDASNPCPAGQSCQGGTCKYAPAGEGQACPSGMCQSGLVCAGTTNDDATCRRTCNPTGTNTCPQGQDCYQLSGGSTDGACFPAPQGTAQEGQSCAEANCVSGLICVGTSASDATCRRSCDPASPSCPTNFECAALTSGSGACVPGTTPPPTGVDECQPCGSGKTCKQGLFCIMSNGSPVCRKGCSTQAACSGTSSCESKSGIPGFSGACTCGGTNPSTQGEGGACTQDSECNAGLLCVADHTQPVGACRKPCTADSQCSATQACTAVGAAKVCEAKTTSGGTDGGTTEDPGDEPRNQGCGCAAGGPGMLAALLGLAGMVRRRRVL